MPEPLQSRHRAKQDESHGGEALRDEFGQDHAVMPRPAT
jgi:hypothetical protein